MRPPVIVFLGAVYPGQFGLLCEHLRVTGLAETYFITTPGYCEAYGEKVPNLLPFEADGKIMGDQSYYYSAKVERSARISRGMLAAVRELRKRTKIDVIFAHALWGAPHFLYDEIDAAIVSYIEFPSYRAHGWDPAYPPDLSQRLADRNMEMLQLHQVLLSDLIIVPSAHAKSMFPTELHGRIEVQMEGFDVQPLPQSPRQPGGPVTIGFAARDLSSAKGIDSYIRIADRLIAEGADARFIALGGATASTYGYEQQWVRRRYNGEVASFRDHLLREYPRAQQIDFPGKLPYDEFARAISSIDIFLYPLRFGVANWGLVEILSRGGCVIATDKGYTRELIINDHNGLLVAEDDEAWMAAIRALMNDPERRARYSENAREMAQSLHISKVAPRYLQLFRRAAEVRRNRLRGR